MTNLLTASEVRELGEHEAVIERGIKTFYEVGRALADIHDRKLYRAEFGTFEEYVAKRWQMSRPRAYELMAASGVASGIPDTLPRPANAGQATALGRIPEPERAEVWAATIERTDGRPTAAAIRETQAQRSEVDLLAGDEWNEPEQTTVADHTPMETVTPTVTTAPKRRPLPAAFDDAVSEVGRSTEKLHRLTEDDRFGRNREQVQHRMPELLAALRTATDALVAMDPVTAQASEEARRWWAASLNTLSQTLAGLAASITDERTTN